MSSRDPSALLAQLIEATPDAISKSLDLLTAGRGYERFEIPKLSGRAPRVIHAPVEALKRVQRALIPLLETLALHSAVHGFRRGRSIVTGAEKHLRARAMLSVDLEDFFHSVTKDRVRRSLTRSLVPRLVTETGELTKAQALEVVELITTLSTHPAGDRPEPVLPQGAPTSPFLANLAARKLDQDLAELLNDLPGDLVYTRYADDLTISSPHEIDRGLVGEVLRRIQRAGFRANPKKIHLASTLKGSPHYRQKLEVTGLVIDPVERVLRIPRPRLELFRLKLHQASNQPALDPETKKEIEGFISFVFMVYRQLPESLAAAYRRFTLAHQLKPLEPGKSRRLARRLAIDKELYR